LLERPDSTVWSGDPQSTNWRTGLVIPSSCYTDNQETTTIQAYIQKNLEYKKIIDNLYGIGKDSYQALLAATRITLLGLSRDQIICVDSLA